jgi:hypothetical protein
MSAVFGYVCFPFLQLTKNTWKMSSLLQRRYLQEFRNTIYILEDSSKKQ